MGQKTERIFDRAIANLEEDNHENALRLFNEILNREPRHLEALRSKALIKISSGKTDEAEDFLLFAIEQQPQDSQLHQMLGTLYLNSGSPEKAFAPLKRAAEINPFNDTAHYGLGLLYGQFQGDHQKAASHFTKAIEISEASAEAYFSRACSFMILQKMEEAERDFQQADKLNHPEAKEMIKEYF
ncbi:MAG TPA: tetratricopeptide repeat protein [Balneolaceae bacterium]